MTYAKPISVRIQSRKKKTAAVLAEMALGLNFLDMVKLVSWSVGQLVCCSSMAWSSNGVVVTVWFTMAWLFVYGVVV